MARRRRTIEENMALATFSAKVAVGAFSLALILLILNAAGVL